MKQRCPLGSSQATIPYGTSVIDGVLRRGRGATAAADGVLAGGGGLSGGELGCPAVVKSSRCWIPDSLRNFKISPAAILTPRGLQ